MAGSRIVARLCSRLTLSTPKLNSNRAPPSVSPLKSAASTNRSFSNSRLPVELRCLGSTMPLHSAIASARLMSMLSSESQSWGVIPQGNAMPL